MIEVGAYTMFDGKTYSCVRIEDGIAYLKNITTQQGRTVKRPVAECPYFKDKQLIVPKKQKKESLSSVININKIIKEHTDLQVSRSAKAMLLDWVEGALGCLVSNANSNALSRGDARITAAHIYWCEMGANNLTEFGYWKENEDHFKR